MGQRRKDPTRVKKPRPSAPRLRTADERRAEVRTVLDRLTELGLTTAHRPVLELLETMRGYVDEGGEKKVDIPYPEVGRRIVGTLTAYVNEPVVVRLKADE
jgi:hypothetical protein